MPSISFQNFPSLTNRRLTAKCLLNANSKFQFKLNDTTVLTGLTDSTGIAPIGSPVENYTVIDLLENPSGINLGVNTCYATDLTSVPDPEFPPTTISANFTVNGVLVYMDNLPDVNGVVAGSSINLNLDYNLPAGNYQFTVNTQAGPIHTPIQSSGSLSVSILAGQVVTGFSIENLDNPSENSSLFLILSGQDGGKVVTPNNYYVLPQPVPIISGGGGTQGPVGPQGPQGIQGETGPQGPQGIQGNPGMDGAIGATGPQGIQGVAGEKGEKGDTGAQGPQGVKGDKGDTGAQGIQGNPGIDGAIGATGPQGIQGVAGEKGEKGDTGAQGIQGVKGDKGDTGAQGPQGIPGPVGPQGPAGSGGSGYWQGNGSNIFYNNGNVGIGTDNPSAKLEVTSDTMEPYILLKGGTTTQNSPELRLQQITKQIPDAPKITFQNPDVSPTNFSALAFRDRGFSFEYPLGSANRLILITAVATASNPIGSVEIKGNLTVKGNKSFIANHPNDPKKEIAYIALEGGESGTYWRGTGQLTSGYSSIALPEHFKLVTSATGITVNLTPRDECNGLRIVSATPNKIEVKELNNGTSSAKFDFFVMGLRIGFENHQPIRDKELEGA